METQLTQHTVHQFRAYPNKEQQHLIIQSIPLQIFTEMLPQLIFVIGH